MFNKLNNLTKMKKHNFLFMVTAIAVLMTGVATFTACDKDNDKKDDTEKKEQKDNIPQGYVDLGLESGTLWKDQNESGQDFYTYEEAVDQFGDKLPTYDQMLELKESCQWQWTGSGYKVIGPNGNSMILLAAGYRDCGGSTGSIGSLGHYWSSTPNGSNDACYLFLYSSGVLINSHGRCMGKSVRLVYHE